MPELYFFVFFLFTLSDYYIPPIGRVFDYLGLLLVVIAVIIFPRKPGSPPLTFTLPYLLLVISLSPFVTLAALNGEMLTASAYAIGLVLVQPAFADFRISVPVLRSQLRVILFVHLAAFYLQYAVFQLSGVLIDYHSMFGVISPRVFNELLNAFRAAGLYQEPNAFSSSIFMLNSVLILSKPKHPGWPFWLSLTALFLSRSLWGFGAIVVLLIVAYNDMRLKPLNIAAFGTLAALAGGGYYIVRENPALLLFLLDETTSSRITNLDSDSSLQGRYAGEGQLGVDWTLFLGHGPNSREFQAFLGANGISFYVYSFGLVGFMLLLTWIFCESKSDRIRKSCVVLFCMTTFPLFTAAIWWAWIALLIRATEPGFPHYLSERLFYRQAGRVEGGVAKLN